MEIKGIIFDMDGVIFDTEKIHMKSWQKILTKNGYDFKEEIYFDCMGVGKEKTKQVLQKNFGENIEFESLYNEKTLEFDNFITNNKVELKQNVIEVLNFLKQKNYKIALATSSKKERVEKYLKQHNLKQIFDVIICGDEVKNYKPNPEIFLNAQNKLNLKKEECLIVEDSISGVLAGVNSGIKVIHIPDILGKHEETQKISYKVFDNILCLKEFLLNN